MLRQVFSAVALSLLVHGTSVRGADLVTRNLADPATCPWSAGGWNSAAGQIGSAKDAPEGPGAAAAPCMEITVQYSGEAFQFFGAGPVVGAVPGRCRKVAVWAKALQDGYSWAVKFKDAQGRDKIGDRKLEWPLRCTAGQWVRQEFTVPDDWPQPIRLEGIAAHNWSRQSEKAAAVLRICGLDVSTDVSGVADRRSLVRVDACTGAEGNVFTDAGPVRYQVMVDSWLGGKLAGRLSWRVCDGDGNVGAQNAVDVSVSGAHGEAVQLSPPRYGVYRMSIDLKLDDGSAFHKTSRFSYIPRPHGYSRQEKLASPYGINIHGGAPGGVAYQALATTGFTWIRDYAYTWEWMLRARGADGRYAGWPWYPKMDLNIRQAGLCLLPCLSGSIRDGVQAGKLAPDRQRKLDLLHILMAFPDYPAWELDNEYDYKLGREEAARNWSAYDAYHKLFAQVVKFVDERTLAVEQGTAGIHPDRVRRSIANGSFGQIDVVNAHFYCGTSPPELSLENADVGQGDRPPMLLLDSLRELAQAADSDGKDRQAWITEFGWDTLAVHIVTQREQAAYLQRGYLLQLQAGIDKMFWYWNLDTKDKPTQFFDGCGLFDANEEPKPASAAAAGMIHLAKLPKPVGTFDLEPGGFGHVIRDGDKLIACAFKLRKDGPPLEATFPNGRLYDMYANPLTESQRRQRLDIAPVWVVGIPQTDPMYLETAYDLESRYLVRVTAGDAHTIRLRAVNNRASPIAASASVQAPQGWTVEPAAADLSVPVGQKRIIPIRVTVDAQAGTSTEEAAVTVREGDVTKRLVTKLLIVPGAEIATAALRGPPGPAKLVASLRNHSLQPRSFALKAEVPGSWKIAPAELSVPEIPGGAARDVTFDVTWNTDWRRQDKGRIVVSGPGGRQVAQASIMPGAIRIPRIGKIAFDGDLSDWPDESRIASWVLGLRGQDPNAEVHMGYSDEGLYLAVRMGRSGAAVPDPKAFWVADCVELFLDTAADKAERKTYRQSDHQFWFCPMPGKGRVYVGRWKRGSEIPETLFDMPGIPSFCKRTRDGYVMEALLPAARIKGFSAGAGSKMGVNLNITVPAEGRTSEVYWPTEKAAGSPDRPHLWGTAELR